MLEIKSITFVDNIDVNDHFEFIIVDGCGHILYCPYKMLYVIRNNKKYYYGISGNGLNSKIFDVLNIEDPNDFVRKIIGNEFCPVDSNCFPEIKSKDNFKKVIHALVNYLEL